MCAVRYSNDISPKDATFKTNIPKWIHSNLKPAEQIALLFSHRNFTWDIYYT